MPGYMHYALESVEQKCTDVILNFAMELAEERSYEVKVISLGDSVEEYTYNDEIVIDVTDLLEKEKFNTLFKEKLCVQLAKKRMKNPSNIDNMHKEVIVFEGVGYAVCSIPQDGEQRMFYKHNIHLMKY